MKRILVIYYTQTGQLKKIVDRVMQIPGNTSDIEVDYEQLHPITEFPFPWKNIFFDYFPECVKGIPFEMKPYQIDTKKEYDLIILAYQTWYLSPSIPFNSFLESEEATRLLKNKPVVTLHGVRNMWISSQEIVKEKLLRLGARLVGNIVLQDKSNNIVSVLTILKWLVHGNKGPYKILPNAGVSEEDIENSVVFGEKIAGLLKDDQLQKLQSELLKLNAVPLKFRILRMEIQARKIFDIFARYILKKGDAGNPLRNNRISVFKYYLLFVIFIVSPIASFIFELQKFIIYPIAKKKILYYQNVEYIKQ